MSTPLLALVLLTLTTIATAPMPGTPYRDPRHHQVQDSVSYAYYQQAQGGRPPPQQRVDYSAIQTWQPTYIGGHQQPRAPYGRPTHGGGRIQPPHLPAQVQSHHVNPQFFVPGGFQGQDTRYRLPNDRHAQSLHPMTPKYREEPNLACLAESRARPFFVGPTIECQCRETEYIIKKRSTGPDCLNSADWTGFNYNGGCFEPHFKLDTPWHVYMKFFQGVEGDCFLPFSPPPPPAGVPSRISDSRHPPNNAHDWREPSCPTNPLFPGPKECPCHENDHFFMVEGVSAAKCLHDRRSVAFRHRFGCFDKGDREHKLEEFLKYSQPDVGDELCFYWRNYQ